MHRKDLLVYIADAEESFTEASDENKTVLNKLIIYIYPTKNLNIIYLCAFHLTVSNSIYHIIMRIKDVATVDSPNNGHL